MTHRGEVLLAVPWGEISIRSGTDGGALGGLEVFPDHAEVSTGMGAFDKTSVLQPGPVKAYRVASRVLVFHFPEADLRLNTPSRFFSHIESALHHAGFDVRHIDPPRLVP